MLEHMTGVLIHLIIQIHIGSYHRQLIQTFQRIYLQLKGIILAINGVSSQLMLIKNLHTTQGDLGIITDLIKKIFLPRMIFKVIIKDLVITKMNLMIAIIMVYLLQAQIITVHLPLETLLILEI